MGNAFSSSSSATAASTTAACSTPLNNTSLTTTTTSPPRPSSNNTVKNSTKSDSLAHFAYDGRLDLVICPELMTHLQSVHDEKGEPVLVWGYCIHTRKDEHYGHAIKIIQEKNMYTSAYGDIFDSIYGNAIPVWKGNDLLFQYEDSTTEIRVAFASRRHAQHFLHCHACYCQDKAWPNDETEWSPM